MDQSIALNCRDLRKHYGQHNVLRGIHLEVHTGSIHGLVGLNGAGKTTTLECILGLRPRDAGEIDLLGYAPEALHQAQGKVAVVFDSPCLHPQLTVRQCLEFARLQSTRQHSSHRQSSHLMQANNESGQASASLSVAEVEHLLGIERYAHFKVRQLSLGNRRRTAIAQALINQPQLVILDEPFNGLDAGGVDDVLALIRTLNQQHNTSFILASHQLAYLEKICSHVAILHEGEICLSDPLSTVLAHDEATVAISVSNPQQATIALAQIPTVELLLTDKHTSNKNTNQKNTATGAAEIHCRLQGISSAQLNTQLVQLGVEVEQLLLHKPSLEAVFYKTIGAKAAA